MVNIDKFNNAQDAAEQAVLDMTTFINAVDSNNNSENPNILPIIGAITTFASIAGTAGSIAQTGLDLANLVGGSSGSDEPGSLEILIINNTKYPLVPYKAVSRKSDIADYGDPILPSESTTFLLTRDEKFEDDDDFDDASHLQFSLMINDAAVDFAYFREDNWIFGYKAADESDFNFTKDAKVLTGGKVTTKGSPNGTKFNFYSTGIESINGKIQMTLYSVDWN